jgi:hypothetical protein
VAGTGGATGSGGTGAGGIPVDAPHDSGGTAGGAGAGGGGNGGQSSSGGLGVGGLLASGGRAGSIGGVGGTTIPSDAALGGTTGSGGTGSGGQTSGSSAVAGSVGTDAGSPSDVVRSEVPVAVCGKLKATIGGSATEESSMQRYAVTADDCHKYILQNNNFADPTGSVQTLTCEGTSFQVVSSTALSPDGSNAPASFPSVYLGGNGNIANGTYLTWSDSSLPIRISDLARALTTFAWSGGVADGDFAASYDVWFSKGKPTAGSYDDAISGSLMIWLNKPTKRQPVGVLARQSTVAGRRWDVWVGGHGSTALGTDNADRPIVSYVVENGPLGSASLDLANFIADAVANSGADQSTGRTSQGFASSWYMTDVAAGFQIWTGSDAAGLKSTSFLCQVK